ncbi:HAD family hydrolase [Sphingobacterium spiritivorum]|uniref:HAD family hydrolase n=1 Tax=Sphingobacterium spiritivorum TaxID=258 RepID=UPI003DA43232
MIERVKALVESTNCGVPNIDTFLQYLKSKNFLLAIATNSPLSIVPVVLQKMGIYQYFDVISSADFVKQGKPHPEIYLHTAKQLNVPPHKCMAIEDSHSGMIAARDAGMKISQASKNYTEMKKEYQINSKTLKREFQDINNKLSQINKQRISGMKPMLNMLKGFSDMDTTDKKHIANLIPPVKIGFKTGELSLDLGISLSKILSQTIKHNKSYEFY